MLVLLTASHVSEKNRLAHIAVSSRACAIDGEIPSQYTCEGLNINPPLEFGNMPQGTKSLAIIVDSPDVSIQPMVHWIMWNVPVISSISENSIPGIEGINSFNRKHYSGPYSPSKTNRYLYRVYALDAKLSIPSNSTRRELEKAMENHSLGYGELMCRYSHKIADPCMFIGLLFA